MRKEWILTEEEKMSKKRRIEENRRLRLSNTNDPKDATDLNEKLDFELQNVVLEKNKVSTMNSQLLISNDEYY